MPSQAQLKRSSGSDAPLAGMTPKTTHMPLPLCLMKCRSTHPTLT